jgi:hypothetical protein
MGLGDDQRWHPVISSTFNRCGDILSLLAKEHDWN